MPAPPNTLAVHDSSKAAGSPFFANETGRWPKSALIIGHPGHELRVLGWVRAATPLVAILTDGSGADGTPRIDQTTQLLGHGVQRSASYGGASDRELYRAILEQDLDYFLALSSRLADELFEHRIECVAGDSIEGYNPTHDLCCLLADRAVRLASARMSVAIRHYAFPLLGSPRAEGLSADGLCLRLTPDELALKLTSIRQYAQSAGGVLVTEVNDLLERFGEQAFAEEVFDRVDVTASLSAFDDAKPFYETYGERQVAAGKYHFVIRYREHMAPIARALATKA